MPRVFEITPKRIKRTNNTVLTPETKVSLNNTHVCDLFNRSRFFTFFILPALRFQKQYVYLPYTN